MLSFETLLSVYAHPNLACLVLVMPRRTSIRCAYIPQQTDISRNEAICLSQPSANEAVAAHNPIMNQLHESSYPEKLAAGL
jgi:hypothetical protein